MKCRDVVLGKASPSVIHGMLKTPWALLSAYKWARALRRNANGKAALFPGKLRQWQTLSQHTQRGMNSPVKHGTEFYISSGERQRHTEPLSHPTATARLAPDKSTLTGCVSSEAPRNHPLLPCILVQVDVPVADGEQELALWHHGERRGHWQHCNPSLAREGSLQFPVLLLWMLGFIRNKTLPFHYCTIFVFLREWIPPWYMNPLPALRFSTLSGVFVNTLKYQLLLHPQCRRLGLALHSFSGCPSQKTCSLC